MKGDFLVKKPESHTEANIYANKSSLVLYWLLIVGLQKNYFSLREAAQETKSSVSLVQRIFSHLIKQGIMKTEGMRTAKRFRLSKPKLLLESWLVNYSIVKKCKIRTYRSGFSSRKDLLNAITNSKLQSKVCLALHSSADALGYKNTNLDTLELYVLDDSIHSEIEQALHLEPQERGYDVVLISPYYKALLEQYSKGAVCPLLLTYLDLYHFPLRGTEQAEYIASRSQELKDIYSL